MWGNRDSEFDCTILTDDNSPYMKAFSLVAQWNSSDSADDWGPARVYRDVWLAANSDAMRKLRLAQGGEEFAPVVVLPYVTIFRDPRVPGVSKSKCEPSTGGVTDAGIGTVNLSEGQLIWLNNLQDEANRALSRQVDIASDGGTFGISFAWGVEEASAWHTVCDSDPYINPVATSYLKPHSESMHPNLTGYAQISRKLHQFLYSSQFSNAAPNIVPAEQVTWTCPARNLIQSTADVILDLTNRLVDAGSIAWPDANPCDTAKVIIHDLTPGSSVQITLQSVETTLAILTVDEDGTAEGVVTIPPGTNPGQHTLSARGFDQDGQYVMSSVLIRVVQATPWWVWAIGVAGVAALLTGLVCLLSAIRAKRRATTAGAAG